MSSFFVTVDGFLYPYAPAVLFLVPLILIVAAKPSRGHPWNGRKLLAFFLWSGVCCLLAALVNLMHVLASHSISAVFPLTIFLVLGVLSLLVRKSNEWPDFP
ncbi:hypothetical protein COY93_00600 [Candidatus Uhrbacteria bacterium CG_4_10_14_0_8_um_filter_58_22]|uniref:Uncharacterized protein n=1 Tax=Candidatus Uhrbacteria bacterium CG_4_10_14_0_8_um_filter_58_22 TaxID=1975029 RepID=A0A2M7QAU7_9BACT|nr:MAG: hypothetical protein AUJ19_04145 [Parcubacteria group bacterium CG1_02_58_44]PIY63287.1 MAG: hypothetical protein COY93_00600 [Candidatus Uhrbacteria bacterium CG_4_10_14_0_8_um_filter_58_22]